MEICFKKSCGFRTHKKGDKKAFCALPKCPYKQSVEVKPIEKQNATSKGVK